LWGSGLGLRQRSQVACAYSERRRTNAIGKTLHNKSRSLRRIFDGSLFLEYAIQGRSRKSDRPFWASRREGSKVCTCLRTVGGLLLFAVQLWLPHWTTMDPGC